jgi:SAM-dependent methyltransferase
MLIQPSVNGHAPSPAGRQQGPAAMDNIDRATVASFGDEWERYDQSTLDEADLHKAFEGYFAVFPWDRLPAGAEGFDMGCGTGRWAKLVAPRVGRLHCIDPSAQALAVARRNLGDVPNADFENAPTSTTTLPKDSQDFGYALGVLHHIPDTAAALADCVRLLKPGAPFLVYLYYRFDNRPAWFRLVWRASELLRASVSRMPASLKPAATDLMAAVIYWPLARGARLAEKLGLSVSHFPLSFYRDKTFYSMRTDSRDRFGTPLEQRFSRVEIGRMMETAGLENVVFSEQEPYWCAVGVRARGSRQ